MKKAGQTIILISFILFICLSNVIWAIVDHFGNFDSQENRNMATRPFLTIENYRDFSNEYTSYFNDHIPFRSALISLNNYIDFYYYKRSSNPNVVIGSDNWLFYSTANDADPIGDCMGHNLYTEEELSAIAANCIAQRDFIVSQGREFVIFIAPNKECIYNDYIPSRYGHPTEMFRTLQLYNYLLENTDLRIVFPYQELRDARHFITEDLYLRQDTHWNHIGAYIGSRALLSELGIQMPAINDDNITIDAAEEAAADLAMMLGLRDMLGTENHEYNVSGYDYHNYELLSVSYSEEGETIYHASDADPRSILVLRDSFGIAMADYIGSQFSECYIRHHKEYSTDLITMYNPDIVVYEIVERNSDSLGSFTLQ